MTTTVKGRALAWGDQCAFMADLEQQTAREPVLAWQQLLSNRHLEEESHWFTPQLALLPDPLQMVDAEKAALRLIAALDGNEAVHIFGDFDADGVNATAVLVEGLTAAGLTVSWEVPHRSRGGHGIAIDSVCQQVQLGCKVGISCDTGITCFAAAAKAFALGMDLIITDHHLPEASADKLLPQAFAILNPAREDCGFADRKLCGCGVAFYLLSALWKLLRADGRAPQYDLKNLLDRVAVATIADMMDLVGINRILVFHGLVKLQKNPSPGMAALLNIANWDSAKTVRVKTVSFEIAPRINAAGRMEHGELAVRLLLSANATEASELATEMDSLNKKRREVEVSIHKRAAARLKIGGVLAAYEEDWHPGVVGLVAGKLARKFHQPAAIGYIDDQEIIHLSLRGVAGFHVQQLLTVCGDLLTRFGGHAGAGGCALPRANWGKFLQRFGDAISAQLAAGKTIKPVLTIDLALTIGAAHLALADRIAHFEPIGKGNPACNLLLRGCTIRKVTLFKGGALSLWLASPEGMLSAIAFRPGGLAEVLTEGSEVSLIGSLARNEWNGNANAQFVVEDVWLEHGHNDD
ncbi:MAG: single-stranded-DNA-specific exonuclease RecJ [Mariprofundales bacterium]